jgi:ribosomal protein S18 acetylase RimI-like enzyme
VENILISDCSLDQIEQVLELQRTWAKEGITIGFVPAAREYLLDKLGPLFIVASDNGRVVGFAYATAHISKDMAVIPEGERYAEIDDIYVLTEYRSRTIGGRLLDKMIGTAQREGIEHFYLYSASKDTDEILSFYKKHGFKSWSIQLYR